MMDEKLVKDGLKKILEGLGEEPQPLRSASLPGQPAKPLNFQQIIRITLFISVGIGVVFFISSLMNIAYQNRILFNQEREKAEEFSTAVLTAIRYPMMTGDQPVIQRQFDEFARLKGIMEIELADFKGMIKRSTDKSEVNKRFEDVKTAKEKQENLGAALSRGRDFSGLEVSSKGSGSKEVFTIIRPIGNEKICASCHGTAQKVLGALRIELDWTPTEQAMQSARQRNITFAFIGMAIMAGLVFSVLSNFTRKK